MKHVLNSTLFTIALIAIAGFFYACNQDELEEVSQESDFTVRVKNGYLEFKDQAAFDQVKASLEDKTEEELKVWESQFKGFTSLRSIEQKAVDAQEAWFQELRNMSEGDRNLLAQSDDDFWYSTYLKENASLFTLQDSGMFSLDIVGPAANLIEVLNSDGIYKVGDEIRVYQDNTLKTILDGDDKKIKTLSSISKSNDELQIRVTEHTILSYKNGETTNGRQEIKIAGGQKAHCSDKNGKDVVSCDVYVLKTENKTPVGKFYRYELAIDAINWYKDGLFGGYTRKRTRYLKVEGAVSIYLNYILDGYTSINLNTGGKLDARIRGVVFLMDDTSGTAKPFFEISGTLDAYGRNNTLCGDSAPNVSNRWR